MWLDLDFADQVIEVKRAYVWAQFKVPNSKASKRCRLSRVPDETLK